MIYRWFQKNLKKNLLVTQMNKRFIFYLLITVVFASVSYVSTENIIVTSIVGGITILYFLLLAEPKIKKALYMNEKYHQCYQFINSFIISINVRKFFSDTIGYSIQLRKLLSKLENEK